MIIEVAEIEERAKTAGQAMLPVVQRAGIAYSTWTRWKREDITPNLKTLKLVRDALDAKIAESPS